MRMDKLLLVVVIEYVFVSRICTPENLYRESRAVCDDM